MTKTEHLNLCRWTEDDAVSVDEINRNFTLLDEGIPMTWKKLMKAETKEDSGAVDLDFSGLDLTQYDGLRIFMQLNGFCTNSSNYIKLHCNKLEKSTDYRLSRGSGEFGYADFAGNCLIDPVIPTFAVLHLWWQDGTLYSHLKRFSDGLSEYALPDFAMCKAALPLQSVNLAANSSGTGVAAGAKFEVWGMKKCS